MSIIDKSYFKGKIVIPSTNKPVVAETVNLFITTEERQFMIDLLGNELYQLMLGEEANEPFKSLIEGADFTMDFLGRTLNLKWNGLQNSDKISPISYYVYCKYRESKNSGFTGSVETKGKKENTVVINPRAKIVASWNLMVDLRGEVGKSFHPYQSSYEVFNGQPTAYNYLLANIDLFPTWIFTPQNYMNVFGF